MTLPMIDEPATDDADTTPYERRGLYAVAVSEVPSADVEGRRAASVWGVIWRILVVVALLCAMSVVQALYYAMVDTRNASPGLLGFAGVTWGTWWGSIILLIVFAVSGLAPAIVAFLTAAARPGRRFAPCMAACVAGMALVWAIIPGNAIGESLWWYECRQSGVCSYFDTGQGILGILPGRRRVRGRGAVDRGAVADRGPGDPAGESGRRETVLGRVLYMLSPAVGSIVLVVNRMVPVGVQTVFAVFLLVLMLGEIVPNELGAVAYVIRKRGSAYWLWPFAIIITWGGPVLHHDGRRADLRTLGRDHPAGGVGVQPSWRSPVARRRGRHVAEGSGAGDVAREHAVRHVEQGVRQVGPVHGGARPEPRHRLRRRAPHRAAQALVQIRAFELQIAHVVGVPRIRGVEYGGFEETDRTLGQPHASRALHISADADREPLVEQPELAQIARHALEGVGNVARRSPTPPTPPVEGSGR